MAQNPAQFVTATSNIGGYHIKCNGQNTGILDATPTFGTAPYTFLWNTGDTAAQIKYKPAGIYIVTATDANQVTYIDTFELTQPQPLVYQSTISDFYGYNINKYAANTGAIELSANGGTPPYKFVWSNGLINYKRGSLTAGTYTFTITDANQCSVNGSITLTQPPPVQINFSNLQNPSCNKSKNGSANLNISGGLGNYSVVWNSGSFSLNPTNLQAGYNTVRIYEQGKAIKDTGITLTEPNALDVAFSISQYNNGYNVSCMDCFNGTISSATTGGTAPYTYVWNNSSTAANLSNLNGGTYTINITDAHACKYNESIELTMPNPKDWSRFGNANIDTSQFIGSTDTSPVVFKSNNQEALRLAGNGNVGVGTASPTEKLEVNGTLKAQGLKIGNFEFKLEPATTLLPEIMVIGRKDIIPIGNIMPRTCLDPLNADRINLFDGAAVFKLQTITPGGSDCKNFDPSFYVGLNGCDGVLEVDESNGNSQLPNKLLLNTFCGKDVFVGKSTSGNLIANYRLGVGVAAPTERFEVNGNGLISGKLGIGNVSPEAALHIKDGVANSLIIESTQTPNRFQIQSEAGATRLINSGSMYFYLNSEQNSNDNSSNFIIAKNAKYYGQSGGEELFKITNDGTGYIKDLWVKAPSTGAYGAFPDYVFANDYKLRTLTEVKTYYLKYKHLPDLPSAKEIKEQGGVSMSEMLIKLTKIVEENTIYLTQQDEQIKQLQAENLKLKKSIEKLAKN